MVREVGWVQIIEGLDAEIIRIILFASDKDPIQTAETRRKLPEPDN